MKLYDVGTLSSPKFQITNADDGILIQDIDCAGNSQATATLLARVDGGTGPDIRKIEVIARWIDAANFAVSLSVCPVRAYVEIWAKDGPVTVFPDGSGIGANFGSGVASVVIPVGTGKIFKSLGNIATIWNYTA